jgi:hypothetical protein
VNNDHFEVRAWTAARPATHASAAVALAGGAFAPR